MKYLLALATVAMATPGVAQNFTTAAEIKPILGATKSSWIAVREYDGKDLLYFTHLEAWRCGLTAIHFSVNGGPVAEWKVEPCYEDTASPNAIKDSSRLPFGDAPLGAIETVRVTITYDDGTAESADFERAAVLIP